MTRPARRGGRGGTTARSHKILLAYDGSPNAEAAIADLRHAGLGEKIQARVLSVTDPWIPPLESMSVATDVVFAGAYSMAAQPRARDAMKEARSLAEKGAENLRAKFPGWTVSSAAVLDAPAQGILHAAEKWRPSLIVLGSKGHTALSRVLLGSVSHKVLTHASCSVRIVRPSSGRSPAPPRVVLAVDGSKDSDAMVDGVARRSWDKDAEFRVVVVLDYRLSLIQNYQPVVRGKVRGVPFEGTLPERLAEQAMVILAEQGLKVTSVVRDGDPRQEIPREIRRFKANSLFVGSRGLHAVQRFLLGSVSSNLAEHAPCTVEVVRR